MKILEETNKVLEKTLPSSIEVTKIEMWGPEIAIYTKTPHLFFETENYVAKIAFELKKRINIRADKSTLMNAEEAKKNIEAIIPSDAGIKDITFTPAFSEVVIEALKPGLVIGKGGETSKRIILETGWTPNILRAPTQESEILRGLRYHLNKHADERKKIMLETAKDIYREITVKPNDWVRMTALGGFREVGRSCILLETNHTRVLLECGVNVSIQHDPYPYLDSLHFPLNELNAVIISHAHMDHCLHPDSLIQLADGEIKKIQDLEEDSVLRAFDFGSGSITNAVARKGISRKDKILDIKTNLFEIKATPEHRFFVIDGLEVKEKTGAELKTEDFIAAVGKNIFDGQPQPLPQIEVKEFAELPEKARQKIRQNRESLGLSQKEVAEKAGISQEQYRWLESGKHNTSIDNLKKALKALALEKEEIGDCRRVKNASIPGHTSENFCQFLGYVLGDGNPHHPKPEMDSNDLAVTDKDVQNLDFYAALAEKVFKTKPRWPLKAKKMGGRNRVFFSSYITRLLFSIDRAILDRSRKRQIPVIIHKSSNKELAAFFRGLYDAEGSVAHHSIRLVSASKMLAGVAQMLLLRFGIWSKIDKIKISPKQFGPGPYYVLTITHPESLKLFAEHVGFSSKAKTEKLEMLIKRIGKSKAEKIDLVPIDGKTLREKLKGTGIFETDFESRISWYWNGEHYPSKKILSSIADKIDEYAIKIGSEQASRQTLRITQKELGSMFGISQATVSLMENGKIKTSNVDFKESMIFEEVKMEKIENARHLSAQLRLLSSQEILWAKIKNIEEEEAPEIVYDLNVPGYENFVANGFIVHNSGFLPFLFKSGYTGPVYCTAPTRDLMTLLHFDFIDVLTKEGKEPPYGERDVKETVKHCIIRDYREVTDIAPDMRLTFHNAAHILGSASVHLHIGEGAHNLVYSADIKFGFTRLLNNVDIRYPRLETLILESTYGGRNDVMPLRQEAEDRLLRVIKETLQVDGNILIPVFSVGRGQEIMLVLENFYRKGLLDTKCYVDGLTNEASAIHTVYPEYMREGVQRRILQNDSPFMAEIFANAREKSKEEVLADGGSIIIASSGMLTGGPSLEYFYKMAENPNNTMIFVGFQGEGALGRKIQAGLKTLPVTDKNGKTKALNINMRVETVEGYSGHSDHYQLVSYVRNLKAKPKRILTNHGDLDTTVEFARYLANKFKVNTTAPRNLDAIRLK